MLASQDYICIFEEENVIVGVIIPDGYRQVYGEILDENRKAKTYHYGFHPEDDLVRLMDAYMGCDGYYMKPKIEEDGKSSFFIAKDAAKLSDVGASFHR